MCLKINYTEFLANRIIGVGIICDNYKLAIAPQKAVLIVGDTFEAELYLARYSSVVSEDVKMSSNSTDLPMREGVAHYSKIETTTGKKTFTAEAVITNPLTKTQTTRKNVFEYEVLPKCSRDCQ